MHLWGMRRGELDSLFPVLLSLSPQSPATDHSPQEILYFGKGKAAQQTRDYYQKHINVTGGRRAMWV